MHSSRLLLVQWVKNVHIIQSTVLLLSGLPARAPGIASFSAVFYTREKSHKASLNRMEPSQATSSKAPAEAPEAAQQASEGAEDVQTFEDLHLKQTLLRGIFAYGFEKPSVIQQKGIRPILSGRDVIAQAQSGTGKTATFSIGVLQQVDEESPDVQALILSPTRELALQTYTVCHDLHICPLKVYYFSHRS